MEAGSSSEALEDINQATWRHISKNYNNLQPFTWVYCSQRRTSRHLIFCDLFHDGVGSDILQSQTLRWLVHVAGTIEVSFEILSQNLIGETEGKPRKPTFTTTRLISPSLEAGSHKSTQGS